MWFCWNLDLWSLEMEGRPDNEETPLEMSLNYQHAYGGIFKTNCLDVNLDSGFQILHLLCLG